MKKIQAIFLILIFLIGFFIVFYYQGIKPYNKLDKSTKIFVIPPGQPLDEIINNLEKEKLIRSKIVFYFVVKKLGIEKKIQAGDFRLSPSMDVYQIAKNLTHGTLDIWVTLVEGLRKEEIGEIISKSFNIKEIEFTSLAKEGYLFPDTYLIPKYANAEIVIKILTDNFNKKFTQDLKIKAAKKGLSENEVVILASLVEKEAKSFADKKVVAGILLKRLDSDWPLQVDATIQYALGYQTKEKTWWKKYLAIDDLKIDSPYNTYKNKGLPPGPICNPGLDSIRAVIEADKDTPYWYYISDKKGNMHYAKTLEEHNQNIEKYLK